MKKVGVAVIAALYGNMIQAQIVTDGTMGSATTLNGPDYIIQQDLGTLSGSNLFHSFQQFHLLQNESAVFRGANDITNVISRVTGGDASVIQGFIKSELSNADFYFINPAGVIFSGDAKVDVPAAFHVATAHELRFANGDVLASASSESSTLSVASPASFGFLGQQSADIQFASSNLKITTGSTASFTAANITLSDSRLKMPSGTLQLNTVGANQASISIAQPELKGNGILSITNSEVNIEGENGGKLQLTSANIESHSSELLVSNTGPMDTAVGIQITGQDVVITDSYVRTETTGTGKAGDILITADNFTLTSTSADEENASELSSESKIFDELPDVEDPDIPDIPTGDDPDEPDEPDEPDLPDTPGGPGTPGEGDMPPPPPPPPPPPQPVTAETPVGTQSIAQVGASGDIVLNITERLTVSTNATISNTTQGSAQGGAITIAAGSLHIDAGVLDTDVGIATLTTGQGQAGNINIAVDEDVLLRGNGQINAMTLGEGDAGNITISAGSLTLEETEESPRVTDFVGIQSLSGQQSDIDNAPTGSSGDITLNIVGELQMLNGGNIVSITVGDGTAGNITINADSIKLESARGRASNTIGSNTLGPTATGDAGNITLNVQDSIELLGNAFVSTTAASKGNAGDMTISARRLVMTGNGDENSRAGINSSTMGNGSSGNAGTVIVHVTEDIRMINGANITSDTANNGNAGNIFISADSLYMAANEESADTGISSGASAERPVTGNAANIFIDVTNAFEMHGEVELKTESESRGNAGSIFIEAGSFLMEGGELESKAEAEDGRFRAGDAGEVSIKVAGHFEISEEGSIASDSFRSGAAGKVTIEAGSMTLRDFSSITSTAALTPGNAGDINISIAGDMELLDGSNIVSDSITGGQAGTINIQAQNLNLSGGGLPTRISSTSVNGRGNAGEINIDVQDTLSMLAGGQITSSSLGAEGDAGEVNITTPTLFIDAENMTDLEAWREIIAEEFDDLPEEFNELPDDDEDLILLAAIIDIQAGGRLDTGISSISGFGARGDAGLITIEANDITIKDGGQINTSSRSVGHAGDIIIATNNLSLVQQGESTNSGIYSRVSDTGQGTAGTINILAEGLVSLRGGEIAVDSGAIVTNESALVDIGNIVISADNLTMSDRAKISSSSTGNVAASDIQLLIAEQINLSDAQITSSAESADAGQIDILANEVFLRDAIITTSVTNEGNGGDIFVGADFILMETGFIQGNTGGEDFSGGSINVDSDFLIVSNRSLITSSDERQQFEPQSGINVIQAAAPDGVSGDVNIGALEFDLSDELASIGGEVLNLDSLQSNPCDTASGSSLARVGKGGQPAIAGGFNVVLLEQADINKRLMTQKVTHQRTHQPENTLSTAQKAQEIASSLDYRSTCTKPTNSVDIPTIRHGAP